MIFGFVAASLAGCISAESATTDAAPESVSTVSQALVIDEVSPLLDAAAYAPGTYITWTSQVGPTNYTAPSGPFEPQDSPGVCGIVYIGGGFAGYDISNDGEVYSRPYVRITEVGNYGQRRFRVQVEGDSYGNSKPRVKVHCVSMNKFSNTSNVPSSEIPFATGGAFSGTGASLGYSDAANPLNMNVWSGVGGYIGSAVEANGGGAYTTFVSKVFRTTNQFTKDVAANVQNRTVAYNTRQPCVPTTGSTPQPCFTQTFGWSYKRNALTSTWTRTVTDQMAVVTNGVSTRRQVAPYAYASQFCYLSGIAGNWNTTSSSASVGSGLVGATIDLVVTGDGAEAGVSCVPYAQP